MIDLLRSKLTPGSQLAIVSSTFPLIAFAVLMDKVRSL